MGEFCKGLELAREVLLPTQLLHLVTPYVLLHKESAALLVIRLVAGREQHQRGNCWDTTNQKG